MTTKNQNMSEVDLTAVPGNQSEANGVEYKTSNPESIQPDLPQEFNTLPLSPTMSVPDANHQTEKIEPLPEQPSPSVSYPNSNRLESPKINLKNVQPNDLSVEEQANADKDMAAAVYAFFSNNFAEARSILEPKAVQDPLYSLGLASMGFTKALTSSDPTEIAVAVDVLKKTYRFADAQCSPISTPLKDTVSNYIQATRSKLSGAQHAQQPDPPSNETEPKFIPNGALRACVIKAQCSLLMAIIYLYHESSKQYIQVGLNLRNAYKNFQLVWDEYQRMGGDDSHLLDSNTVSALQFGLGVLHVFLSSFPSKVLKFITKLGYEVDQQKGMKLLKKCAASRQHLYSPIASVMILSYYTSAIASSPNILTDDLRSAAKNHLEYAQEQYPDSLFFMFYAGLIERSQKNVTQSSNLFNKVAEGDDFNITIGRLAAYEIMLNDLIQRRWSEAERKTIILQQERYGSPGVLEYICGSCAGLSGKPAEAVLYFANTLHLLSRKSIKTAVETFVHYRTRNFEKSGYQDGEFNLPLFELMYVWNLFPVMERSALEDCLGIVEGALDAISEREETNYKQRIREFDPTKPAPELYIAQRAVLLLVKSGIQNSLGRHEDTFEHIYWILDRKRTVMEKMKWVVPFAYWESGVTKWCQGDRLGAKALWMTISSFSDYAFEQRLTTQLNMALQLYKEE